jgi:hypothetical protein
LKFRPRVLTERAHHYKRPKVVRLDPARKMNSYILKIQNTDTQLFSRIGWGDDDDDVYLDRITQHKPKNYLPYVKYRPARKGISMKKKEQFNRCNKKNETKTETASEIKKNEETY